MKKFLTSFLMAALFSGVAAKAATVIADAGEGKYTISTGKTTMTVATDGGKILSYQYGDKEIISQTRFPNSFGSTFWTSPQKEWNWPPVAEFDRLPYTVENGTTLIMTSQKSERLGFVVRKEFAVDETSEAILITYAIINKSDQTRQVAPWEITRVPNDGIIFFDTPIDKIWPADLMKFQSANGVAWYQADEAPENRKVNADGKGWLAYCANGLLLVKKFEDLDASQPAPGEAEIQIYVNQRKTFIEIESQGAYTTLQPGEELKWTVRWSLCPYDGTPEPSETLLKIATK